MALSLAQRHFSFCISGREELNFRSQRPEGCGNLNLNSGKNDGSQALTGSDYKNEIGISLIQLRLFVL
jgi:hypothetical protein